MSTRTVSRSRRTRKAHPAPITLEEVNRLCLQVGSGYTPDYARRLQADIKYSRSADSVSLSNERGALLYEFAALVESKTGRHVTPQFYRLVTEALRYGLKRPSESEMQRYARDVYEGLCRRGAIASAEEPTQR